MDFTKFSIIATGIKDPTTARHVTVLYILGIFFIFLLFLAVYSTNVALHTYHDPEMIEITKNWTTMTSQLTFQGLGG